VLMMIPSHVRRGAQGRFRSHCAPVHALPLRFVLAASTDVGAGSINGERLERERESTMSPTFFTSKTNELSTACGMKLTAVNGTP